MLTRRRSFDAFQQLRDELDRHFPQVWDALSTVAPRAAGVAFPPMNVWEEGDQFFAEAELPGVKNEDLDISVVGNELTVKGQRGDAASEGVSYHRRERGTGSFVRVIRLPVEIDAERVSARLQSGVLLITLPKSEAARPRKIQVQAN
jgi:HSP20 family protein